ncbi:hypothetical protein [Kineococcus sp. R86509]|uniref:hypothetical protein n=1 Tax=Kineococcus sp. R86509 TaxID=3093851 RepID=UPI0036D3AEB0
MAQAAELDLLLELPDELLEPELPEPELLVLPVPVLVELVLVELDGVLEPVDSLGVLLLDELSEDVDELRESLR